MTKPTHYFKDVTHKNGVDVYRFQSLLVWRNRDPCVQHAVKKLLCSGQRGVKDTRQDVQEAITSLVRCLEMQTEDETK